MEQTAFLSSYENTEDSENFIDEETLLPSDLLCDLYEQHQQAVRPFNYLLDTEISCLVSQMKTHRGSIFLQNLLEEMGECDVDELLKKLNPFLIEIMCSHYGNYFIQKLFQKLTLLQRLSIFDLIKTNFLEISTDNCGTHSIQALIEVVKTPMEGQIIENLLKQNLLLLFNNKNSNHIIQKIIIDYPETKRNYLNRFFIENMEKIISNENGLQCAFKFVIMNNLQPIRLALIQAVTQSLNTMTSNGSGCSFILFILEKFGYASCCFMINEIKRNIFIYGTKKPFSLIVERLIDLIFVNDNDYLLTISNAIFTNEKCLIFLNQSQNAMKLLFAVMKHLNPTQRLFYKKLIEDKILNKLFIKDKDYFLQILSMV